MVFFIRLLDWGLDKLRGERFNHEKIVIVKNLFQPEMLVNDVTLVLDYQNKLREACSKFGTVKKVIIYDVRLNHTSDSISGE